MRRALALRCCSLRALCRRTLWLLWRRMRLRLLLLSCALVSACAGCCGGWGRWFPLASDAVPDAAGDGETRCRVLRCLLKVGARWCRGRQGRLRWVCSQPLVWRLLLALLRLLLLLLLLLLGLLVPLGLSVRLGGWLPQGW